MRTLLLLLALLVPTCVAAQGSFDFTPPGETIVEESGTIWLDYSEFDVTLDTGWELHYIETLGHVDEDEGLFVNIIPPSDHYHPDITTQTPVDFFRSSPLDPGDPCENPPGLHFWDQNATWIAASKTNQTGGFDDGEFSYARARFTADSAMVMGDTITITWELGLANAHCLIGNLPLSVQVWARELTDLDNIEPLTAPTGTATTDILVQGTFRRGYANDDAVVDISDPVYILAYLSGSNTPPCLDALDANDDDAVDIADPVYLLDYLLNSGTAPPVPFSSCGLDATHTGTTLCNDTHPNGPC